MNWIQQILRRGKLDRDLAREIDQHLDESAAELIAEGMPPCEAKAVARRQFGNVTFIEERGREVWRWSWIENFLSDVRYAVRQLSRSPAFTLTAIVTLALGIGGATAVFTVTQAVLLQPLPFTDQDQLVSVQAKDIRGAPHPTDVSYPNFFDFRRSNTVFEHLVSYRDDRVTLTGLGTAQNLTSQIVSWNLFPLLRVQPVLGRGFLPSEEKRGERAVILSHQLWKDQFGADPGIVGRPIQLDSVPYTVVGVAPTGFNFPVGQRQVQVWCTIGRDAASATVVPMTEQRGAHLLNVIGRLKPGVSRESAEAQIDTLAAGIARQYSDARSVPGVYVRFEHDRLAGDAKYPLAVLAVAVGLLLLVACANIANLLLARTSERAREFSIRIAIGAGRGRVVRQLLAENLILGLLGAGAGVIVAATAVRVVVHFGAGSLPRLEEASINPSVLLFSSGLALLTSVLFSIPAVRQTLKSDAAGSLPVSTRQSTDINSRFRGGLVVAQITLGLILVSSAGLLASTFIHFMNRDLGLRPERLLTFQVTLSDAHYDYRKQIDFCGRLLETLNGIPGVNASAAGMPLPLTGSQMTVSFNIPERPSSPGQRPSSNMAIVTPGYFRTIGTPLLEGREFSERDDEDSPSVLVVNRAFAQKFFPGENAIGKILEPGATSRVKATKGRRIIGVVGNARQSATASEDEAIYYFPLKQMTWGLPSILVRTSVEPLTLEHAIRERVAALDAEAPVTEMRSMEDVLVTGVARPRLITLLMGSFATIALLLLAVGLYGLMAYTVSRRTAEIGVRMALGAEPGAIFAMVLRRAMVLVLIAIPMGLAGAAAGMHVLSGLVHGATTGTPTLLIAACVVVAVVAGVAAYLPARRAASIDPLAALRSE